MNGSDLSPIQNHICIQIRPVTDCSATGLFLSVVVSVVQMEEASDLNSEKCEFESRPKHMLS